MNKETSKLTVRISAQLKDDFKVYAAQEGFSMQELITKMLQEKLSADSNISSADKNFSLN